MSGVHEWEYVANGPNREHRATTCAHAQGPLTELKYSIPHPIVLGRQKGIVTPSTNPVQWRKQGDKQMKKPATRKVTPNVSRKGRLYVRVSVHIQQIKIAG